MKKIILLVAVMLFSLSAFTSESGSENQAYSVSYTFYINETVPPGGCTIELIGGGYLADAVENVMYQIDGENHHSASYRDLYVYVDTANGNTAYLKVGPGWSGKPSEFTIYIYDLSYTYTFNVSLN